MILRGGATYAAGNEHKSRVLETSSALVAAVQLIDGFCQQRQLWECFFLTPPPVQQIVPISDQDTTSAQILSFARMGHIELFGTITPRRSTKMSSSSAAAAAAVFVTSLGCLVSWGKSLLVHII